LSANNTLDIPFKKLDETIQIPEYAYPGDAGVDLRANKEVVLEPFERALIPTSFALAIPLGYAGFVLPRSGLSIKQGISLINTPGLIDSNFRGELCIAAINLDAKQSVTIKRGDRIAQLVVVRVENVKFSVCASLPNSDRGELGFGSSGL